MTRQNGHYLDIPEADYHAIPRVGSSWFKDLAVSPGHFKYRRDNPRPDTEETRLGRALHVLTMEPHRFDSIAVLSPHDDYRTKEAKAWRDETIASGAIPLKADKWAEVHRWRDALLSHPTASALLKPGDDVLVESTILWDYNGIPAKARPDVFRAREGIIVDVKTTACVHESEWDREVASTGLYYQPWWYLAAAETTDAAPDAFAWVVVSKEAPYAVWVRTADRWMEPARRRGENLLSMYRACQDSGRWPSSSAEVVESIPPPWFLTQTEEACRE